MNKKKLTLGLKIMLGVERWGPFISSGVIWETKLQDNISFFAIPSYRYNGNTELSLQTGIKLHFTPSPSSQHFKKDSVKKHTYSIALGTSLNLLPEKYDSHDRDGYPYIIEDGLSYKNAFGYIFKTFPIIEFNLHNKHRYTHAIRLGYQYSRKDDLSFNTLGGTHLFLNDYHISYQLERPFSKKKMTERNNMKYLYGGAGVSINYKKFVLNENIYWDTEMAQTTTLYNSKFLLGLLQFPIGYKTHLKRKSFYLDMGININLLAYSTGNYNYSYQKQDNVSGKIIKNDSYTDHTSKLLSFPDLWGNLHLFNNLFFKVGYQF